MITAGIYDFSTMIGVFVCNIANVKERVIYPWIDQMGLIWRWKCREGSKRDISADFFAPCTHAGAWVEIPGRGHERRKRGNEIAEWGAWLRVLHEGS
jgi:hypothetical protein